jgi:hypothetical protein
MNAGFAITRPGYIFGKTLIARSFLKKRLLYMQALVLPALLIRKSKHTLQNLLHLH